MKLKYKISLYFLILSGLLIIASSVTHYIIAKRDIISQIHKQLESVSEIKFNSVKSLVHKKFQIATVLSTNYRLIQTVRNHPEGGFTEDINSLLEYLDAYDSLSMDIRNIHIVNKKGKVIASSIESVIGTDLSGRESFIRSVKGERYLNGFRIEDDGHMTVILSVPLVFQDSIIAVIITEMTAMDIVSLMTEYTGLGQTGETTLAEKSPEPVYISNLRFDTTAALNRTFDIHNLELAMTYAIRGIDTLLQESIDYRGEKVIAITKIIPGTDWGMVTKIDRDEAEIPLVKLRKTIIFLDIFLAFVIGLFAYILGNRLAKPIEVLNCAVLEIKNGDYSKTVPVNTSDEIGMLAQSFNSMAGSLKTYVNELENSNESLNKYAYIISHDLKAPVQTIYSLTAVIEEDYGKELPAEAKDLLMMISSKAMQMEVLIQDVLSTAKSGVGGANKEKIESDKLIRSVITSLHPPSNVSISIPDNLPTVYFNRTMLYQVFQNLISNAIKYNDKEKTEIKIHCLELEKKYKFSVEDNGPGIRKEKFSDIFIMFKSAEETQRKDSSGIGLGIVKKIITENGGEVWVDSEPGKGATFSFTILKQGS